MASKTPNLDKSRSAWSRWQNIFLADLPSARALFRAQVSQARDIRKR